MCCICLRHKRGLENVAQVYGFVYAFDWTCRHEGTRWSSKLYLVPNMNLNKNISLTEAHCAVLMCKFDKKKEKNSR